MFLKPWQLIVALSDLPYQEGASVPYAQQKSKPDLFVVYLSQSLLPIDLPQAETQCLSLCLGTQSVATSVLRGNQA